MAFEWVKVDGDPTTIDFTVASGTAIEKGALLQLTDPRTASAVISGAVIAGVAATEKSITEGDVSTELGLWVGGGARFLVTASGAITAGQRIMAGNPANMVTSVLNTSSTLSGSIIVSGAQVIGYALEDIADNTTGEVVLAVGGS